MPTAGEALRARMDAGKLLEWSETEVHHLDAASRCADRIELLQPLLAGAIADGDSAAIVKLSGELRLLDKAVGDHLAKVHVGPDVAKSGTASACGELAVGAAAR